VKSLLFSKFEPQLAVALGGNLNNEISMFGVRMHPWSVKKTLETISARLDEGVFTQHVVVNVAKLVHMQRDRVLFDSVVGCDIINIDGMGVVWGGRFLGLEIPERVAGVDLFHSLLALATEKHEPVFLLGATEDVLEQAVINIKAIYPGLIIAGYHHGYFWDNEAALVERVKNSGAAMLFVAVTSPKKEAFINRWREQLGVKFVMGVGGTFDVVAGKTKRAPVWMQNYGMEWLYRLLQEPKRMWKRYVYTNLQFFWMLVRARLFGK
jgi:N-acetylglucosaminyldiphosphoundecaprenol N-acetyl-beta-D-mannosaminyltransferase